MKNKKACEMKDNMQSDLDDIKIIVKSTTELILLITETDKSSRKALIKLKDNANVSPTNGIHKFYSAGHHYIAELNNAVNGVGNFVYNADIDLAYVVLSEKLSNNISDHDLLPENIAITVCAYYGLTKRGSDKRIMRSATTLCDFLTNNDLRVVSKVTGTPYSTLSRWFSTRLTLFVSVISQFSNQRLNSNTSVISDRVISKILPIIEELDF